jgi:hypothetical protein
MTAATTESGQQQVVLPQPPVPDRDLEAHVMRVLQAGGIQGESLREMAKAVATLNSQGFRPVRVFPKGIPAPDGTWFQTLIPLNDASRLIDILRQLPQIDEIRIFPKGIPRPDLLQLDIGLR